MKLVQVDPSEAIRTYTTNGGFMPRAVAEKILDRFLESGVKCCRIEDDHYTHQQMSYPLRQTVNARKRFRDSIVIRHNNSKIYLIRK